MVIVTFLSDFGRGPYAGICRGVIKSVAPRCEIIDLTHDIPAFDVRAGALALAESLPHMPVGVHLAIVDPGVGTSRRPVAIAVQRGDRLVGPDNGLFSLAWDELGGVRGAWEIRNTAWWRHPVAATFHGRDIFAPAAGRLAAGSPPAEAGPSIPKESLARLHLPEPAFGPGRIEAQILAFDAFGSALLNVRGAPGLAAGQMVQVTLGDRPPIMVRFVSAFGDVSPGEPCLLVDSSGWLHLAINLGSAREALRLERDMAVLLETGGQR